MKEENEDTDKIPVVWLSYAANESALYLSYNSFNSAAGDAFFRFDCFAVGPKIRENKKTLALIDTPDSGFSQSVMAVCNYLKSKGYTHSIVLLDDFLFYRPFSFSRLNAFYQITTKLNRSYFRLRSPRFSIYDALSKKDHNGNPFYLKLSKECAYYSSLQASIWRLDYLSFLVESVDNPWDFELIRPDAMEDVEEHFAVRTSVLSYIHFLESGNLNQNAFGRGYDVELIKVMKEKKLKCKRKVLRNCKGFLFGKFK